MRNKENNQPSQRMRSSRKNRKKHRTAKIVALCVLVLLTAVAVFATYYVNNKLDKIDIVETPKGDAQWGIDAKVSEDLKNYENIAILGVDNNKSKGNKFDGARSDEIMIASINKKTGDVKLTSVMRDTYLEIQDKSGNYKLDKVTHAHAFGGGLDTCRALNRNLDLNITQFVIFSWKSVADLVDSMGGIELDVKANELNDLNAAGPGTATTLGKSYTPVTHTGLQKLDGVQVAAYCRIRHNSGGDDGRTERGRATLVAIFHKAKGLGPSELNRVADESLPGIRTNIKNNEIFGYLLNINKYNMGASGRFPYKYHGGLLGAVWYGVPVELESNVAKLHLELFQQENYKPSSTLLEINAKIIEKSGYHN